MDQPALIFNGIYLYWHGIFMAAAIALGIGAAVLLSRLFQRDKASDVFDAALLAIPCGLVLSRLLYCISNFEEYHSLTDLLRFAEGGYGLSGAILGAFLAAVVLHTLRKTSSLGAICDSLAAGGALGIAAGKLTGYVSLDNVGEEITQSRFQCFPLSVYDPSTDHWFLATFLMVSVAELVIFGILCGFFAHYNDEKKGIRGQNGDIALLFLLLHGAVNVAFDTMQTDALRFPGNSFVMMQQVFGAIALVAVMTVWTVRSAKRDGFRRYHLMALTVFAAAIGIAAWMEFDRISDTNYYRNHIIQFLAMLCASAIGLAMYRTTLPQEQTES